MKYNAKYFIIEWSGSQKLKLKYLSTSIELNENKLIGFLPYIKYLFFIYILLKFEKEWKVCDMNISFWNMATTKPSL